jgi:hypothetical protein
MIRETLIPALKQKYPDEQIRFGSPPDAIAVFVAPHPGIGELHLMDYETEVIAFVGEITHGHFSTYNGETTQDEIDQAVTESVLEFLEDTFQDKVLFYQAKDGKGSGWQTIDSNEITKGLTEKAHCYVWSGPYQPTD